MYGYAHFLCNFPITDKDLYFFSRNWQSEFVVPVTHKTPRLHFLPILFRMKRFLYKMNFSHIQVSVWKIFIGKNPFLQKMTVLCATESLKFLNVMFKVGKSC